MGDYKNIIGYIVGADRNNPDEVRAHMYAKLEGGGYLPMCDYGWNRSNGECFSILRGNLSARGTCRICERRVAKQLPPVEEAREHRTRWL